MRPPWETSLRIPRGSLRGIPQRLLRDPRHPRHLQEGLHSPRYHANGRWFWSMLRFVDELRCWCNESSMLPPWRPVRRTKPRCLPERPKDSDRHGQLARQRQRPCLLSYLAFNRRCASKGNPVCRDQVQGFSDQALKPRRGLKPALSQVNKPAACTHQVLSRGVQAV